LRGKVDAAEETRDGPDLSDEVCAYSLIFPPTGENILGSDRAAPDFKLSYKIHISHIPSYPSINLSLDPIPANSTELSPSRETPSCAAAEGFPNNLRCRKVQWRVHESPQLVPTLNDINPVHITPSYISKISLRSILILCSHLRLDLPSGLLLDPILSQLIPVSSSTPRYLK
jgi:hypothetical protein